MLLTLLDLSSATLIFRRAHAHHLPFTPGDNLELPISATVMSSRCGRRQGLLEKHNSTRSDSRDRDYNHLSEMTTPPSLQRCRISDTVSPFACSACLSTAEAMESSFQTSGFMQRKNLPHLAEKQLKYFCLLFFLTVCLSDESWRTSTRVSDTDKWGKLTDGLRQLSAHRSSALLPVWVQNDHVKTLFITPTCGSSCRWHLSHSLPGQLGRSVSPSV